MENAHDGSRIEECDAFLDPEHPETFDVLDRYFLPMAARAAGEQVERDIDRMSWLHDYTLLVREGDNKADVILRYRKG